MKLSSQRYALLNAQTHLMAAHDLMPENGIDPNRLRDAMDIVSAYLDEVDGKIEAAPDCKITANEFITDMIRNRG